MAAASQSKIDEPQPKTPATEITIRDAIEADLSAIVEIHNAAIASGISTAQLEPVTVEDRRKWFRAHSTAQYPIWLAELGRRHCRRRLRATRSWKCIPWSA